MLLEDGQDSCAQWSNEASRDLRERSWLLCLIANKELKSEIDVRVGRDLCRSLEEKK